MEYGKKEINVLFRVLKNTSGVLHAFMVSSDATMYASDENNMSNNSVELKIFMESIRFLDQIKTNGELNFKLGHWNFENSFLSLYSINDNKLLIIHSAELNWEEFDIMIIDVLLTL